MPFSIAEDLSDVCGYKLLDVFDTLDRFGRRAEYGAAIELTPGLRIRIGSDC